MTGRAGKRIDLAKLKTERASGSKCLLTQTALGCVMSKKVHNPAKIIIIAKIAMQNDST